MVILVAFMAWLGVTLGSMVILMIRHLTGGGWGTVIRRILGAAMRCVPLMTILFMPILFGLPRLYIWARPLDSIADKHLREHLARHHEIISLGEWVHCARRDLLRHLEPAVVLPDQVVAGTGFSPALRDNTRFKVLSGPGLILYAFTVSFAAIDWVMSLDPSWISTIYGLVILIGQLLSAMCFAVVVERILVKYKPMSDWLKPDFVQDHGKWMLTFIMVWAYFTFSQWLIIWAGNLPDEITWYMRRLNGGWGFVGLWLVVFHFAVPFVILLSRSFKRDIGRMVWLATWMLLMHYLDLFWIIEPNFSTRFSVSWADVVLPVAMGGLWLWFFFRNLNSLPLLPVHDVDAKEVWSPCMAEEVRHAKAAESGFEHQDLSPQSVYTFLVGLAVGWSW